MRRLSLFDELISQADAFLKVASGHARATGRPSPAQGLPEPHLEPGERRLVGRLMRVNHAGEIAAQGLYQGQMLSSRRPEVRSRLDQSAREEGDHLNWCAERAHQMGTHTSLLGPFWYLGSVVMGAAAGFAGDRYSLGFVDETERQVERHLDHHLQRLPRQDNVSAAILQQMKQEEVEHGAKAMDLGGQPLPWPVRKLLMPAMAGVMTRTAYWI
ncbi:2-octaprenyl-3-methyl-6-methoxy-1,4-benzoquinol hydroxylase [Thioalkalivibrio nitratireducens DSM 14787]|uniref:3-demethoxyubiquinol 3-hydroxylase n=1 Tax=Thioalkalivibrio nitratireducens (strain DSM 14787 / UNIQEM 213 / ALEN2) TaxID=1255043 RepID=L0DSV1_THIND|nr:2-polyprenyl-3-methyl-6-methoxy-1,4-benzoquinone monooxygenase [Thioalkalivibrio nitratireducens]AGA32072.1 2-octaprenyl-3-methyl-6-methoxy-1,4-benzoquinol hydroxylase [Thioalkalivibrio nitratireducens DSM 14787]